MSINAKSMGARYFLLPLLIVTFASIVNMPCCKLIDGTMCNNHALTKSDGVGCICRTHPSHLAQTRKINRPWTIALLPRWYH